MVLYRIGRVVLCAMCIKYAVRSISVTVLGSYCVYSCRNLEQSFDARESLLLPLLTCAIHSCMFSVAFTHSSHCSLSLPAAACSLSLLRVKCVGMGAASSIGAEKEALSLAECKEMAGEGAWNYEHEATFNELVHTTNIAYIILTFVLLVCCRLLTS